MEGYYEVKRDHSAVGKVQVIKTGLYYRFICRCQLLTKEVSRLVVCISGKTIPLGVLVPEGDGLSLDKKVSFKQFPQGDPTFQLKLLNEKTETETPKRKFVPLSPEEPFAYLEKLKDSYYAEENGVKGLWIPEEREDLEFQEKSSSSPTGQWSEPMTWE